MAAIDARMAEIRREAGEVFRGWVTATFHANVMETPQWSGNAAANWRVGIDRPIYSSDTSFKQGNERTKWKPKASKGEGGLPAVYRACREFRRGAFDQIGLFSASGRPMTVYISNDAKNLNHESYIQFLEENPKGFLRSVNEPGHMVERAAHSAGNLGVLTPADVATFRAIRPGNVRMGRVKA